jgi:hypothetical protein
MPAGGAALQTQKPYATTACGPSKQRMAQDPACKTGMWGARDFVFWMTPLFCGVAWAAYRVQSR